MTDVLVDSSFVYALYSTKDQKHRAALEFSEQTTSHPLIPDVVLPEVTFLFHRAGGVPAVKAFLHNFVEAGVETIPLQLADIRRVEAIMTTYASADLDFVDCAIMALAERLNIRQILTFDRRDFSIVRPQHSACFELLP
jgi:predicted nucleic acid-binding protein